MKGYDTKGIAVTLSSLSPREVIGSTWGLVVEMAHYVDLVNKE